MTDLIITLSISCIPRAREKAEKEASVPVNTYTMLTKNRVNWIENKTMPDSINMNMTRRSLLPPVTPKIWSSAVPVLTSRNTLKILNTINPVTRAFTVIDSVRPVRVRIWLHIVVSHWPCTLCIGATPCAIQMARNHRLRRVGEWE